MLLPIWELFDSCCEFIKDKAEFTHLFLSCFSFTQMNERHPLPPHLLDIAIEKSKKMGKKLWIEMPLQSASERNLDIFVLDKLSAERQQYLDSLRKRIDDIDHIVFSWSHCGESGAYYRWTTRFPYKNILKKSNRLSIKPTLKEFDAMLKFVKDFQEAGKLAFSAIDVPFEREAYLYQNNLENAPLLNWLKSHNVPNIIYRGCWLLDKSLREHKRNYQVVLKALSPIIAHQKYDSGSYPYSYYQDYLKAGSEFWSGVGYDRGILRGNYNKLTELGYKGVLMTFNAENIVAWESLCQNSN